MRAQQELDVTGWMTTHTDFITINEGQTVHYQFNQEAHVSGNEWWLGWVFGAGKNNDTMNGKTGDDLKAAALFLVLNDNINEKEVAGNAGGPSGDKFKGCTNDFPFGRETGEFSQRMRNAYTDMFITLQNGELQMTSLMEDDYGRTFYNNFKEATSEKSLKVFLSANNAKLTIWTAELITDASYVISKATLDHTASTSCGTDNTVVTYTHNSDKEKYHNQGSGTYQGYAFAQYSYKKEIEEDIQYAQLNWSAVDISSSGGARNHDVYYLNSGFKVDFAAIDEQTAGLLRFNGQKTLINNYTTARNVTSTDQQTDVTNAVTTVAKDHMITFQWTNTAGGANLCGYASNKQPVLTILKKVNKKPTSTVNLWDFTHGTNLNDANVYGSSWPKSHEWTWNGNTWVRNFGFIVNSSADLVDTEGLWFGKKVDDGTTVEFNCDITTSQTEATGAIGYMRPMTSGATISVPVQAGQVVTFNIGKLDGNNSCTYTLKSLNGGGTQFADKSGTIDGAARLVIKAETDGWVDFTYVSGSHPEIRWIRVDEAPGFLSDTNEKVDEIPDQKAELIYLEFEEPEIIMPEGASLVLSSSDPEIAFCPQTNTQQVLGQTWPAEATQVGQVRFVGTGKVTITATITYGDYSKTLSYNVLVHADEGSFSNLNNTFTVFGHDIRNQEKTTGGKLLNQIVNMRSITAEFGPTDIFNTTIVRAVTGKHVDSKQVGVTTLANNGWRDAYFRANFPEESQLYQNTDSLKKPTQGTFYRFVPKANGTLTVSGYLTSGGAPAIMVDATNGYAQVGNTINYTADLDYVTSTFELLKGHDYYLFGVNPNYPDYQNYAGAGTWATYQLVSFHFEQYFKIVTTESTTYLKDANNNAIQTSSVVRPRNTNTYTANFEGASGNVTATVQALGNISGATVTVQNGTGGKGSIKVDWNTVGEGEGGALLVVANDGTNLFFTITVPYDKFVWDMHNYQTEVDKQLGAVDLLDWTTTYEVRQYSDQEDGTRTLAYLNGAILTSAASIQHDNAAYIGQTAGLIVESSDNSFGVAYDPPYAIQALMDKYGITTDVNGDGNINSLDIVGHDRERDEILRGMLNHVYTEEDKLTANIVAMEKKTYLTIPSLKKGQHVALKAYRHGPGQGDNIHVYNAHNLKKWIDGEEYTSSDPTEVDVSVFNQTGGSQYAAKYGWVEFVVANDGDVTFKILDSDNGFTHIKKIAVSGVGEEIDDDMKLRVGTGNTAHLANTLYLNKHIQGNAAGVTQQFSNSSADIHCENTLGCEFRIRNIKGTFSKITLTSGDGTYTYTANSSAKGRFNAPVAYTESYAENFSGSNAAINGQGGLLTVEDGQGTFDIEQIAYSKGNAVEFEKTPIQVIEVGEVEQEYPYTWDFTNISTETKESITENNNNWATAGTTNMYHLNGSGLNNYVQGTELTTTGGNTGTTIPEYDGLGFLTSTQFGAGTGMQNVYLSFPDGKPETPSHGNSEGMVIGDDEITTLLVPKVPAGMTVYVRTGNRSTNEGYVSMSGDIDGRPDNQPKTALTDEYGNTEYVHTYTPTSADQDVYIDVKDVTVKGIAVSKFTKRCWFKNEIPGDAKEGYSYNTDSHDVPIDYTLTKYFTGKDIQAYTIGAFNPQQSSVALKYVYRAPVDNGYVVETKYENDVVEKLPLFVPSKNDQEFGMTDLGSNATLLQPHVAAGPIETSDDSYYFILTNLWYNVKDESLSGSSQKAQVPGFYRLYESDNSEDNNLSNNRAVLCLPKEMVDGNEVKQFIPLFQFEGDFADEIDVIPAESTESGIDVNGTFYTLQGMKVQGFPKKSGIYMQNGKKILVK